MPDIFWNTAMWGIGLSWLAVWGALLAVALRRCGYPWRAAFQTAALAKTASWFLIAVLAGILAPLRPSLGPALVLTPFAGALTASWAEASVVQQTLMPKWNQAVSAAIILLNLGYLLLTVVALIGLAGVLFSLSATGGPL